MALSLVIASVPVALPMVMQITMAIGARKMADHKAIVTHLTALQEIASMTVLCSDKTGTLTTAHITVMPNQIWCNPSAGYSAVGATMMSPYNSNTHLVVLQSQCLFYRYPAYFCSCFVFLALVIFFAGRNTNFGGDLFEPC